jgi:hypothetical protein
MGGAVLDESAPTESTDLRVGFPGVRDRPTLAHLRAALSAAVAAGVGALSLTGSPADPIPMAQPPDATSPLDPPPEVDRPAVG